MQCRKFNMKISSIAEKSEKVPKISLCYDNDQVYSSTKFVYLRTDLVNLIIRLILTWK